MKGANRPLKVAGLFAGIGGMEVGLGAAGHEAVLLAENYAPARSVLESHFPDVPLKGDVRELRALPADVDLLVAGFPCQDLSSVGQKRGIAGTRSKLVGEVFRLLRHRTVPWVLLENVPFIRQLGRGKALTLITSALEELGYRWAYRVLDTEAFGLPQRRNRWFLLASQTDDPRGVLLPGSVERPLPPDGAAVACGFYWTEGMRSLGWAVDAVPPIKGGSSVGVPSPPAIRLPEGALVLPDLRDAERLQGFAPGWTQPAENVARPGFRWQLVGNAVSVPVAEWLGHRLMDPPEYGGDNDMPFDSAEGWPAAAWYDGDIMRSAAAGPWPFWRPRQSLAGFLDYPTRPLSHRAAAGFMNRTQKGSLNFPEDFIEQVSRYVAAVAEAA